MQDVFCQNYRAGFSLGLILKNYKYYDSLKALDMNKNINKKKRKRSSVQKKEIIISAAALLPAIAVMLYLALFHRAGIQKNPPAQTVQASALHLVYRSVESMVNTKDASLVAEGVVIDDGTVRSSRDTADENVPPNVHTDYRVKLTRIVKKNADARTVVITLMGGAAGDANYVVEGVPTLKRGDRIVMFASYGDDGKYYPLSGGAAIAFRDSSGKFNLSDEVISGQKRSFTIDELAGFAR